jgi:NAD(P)-dependent dehydrogenase (short-subunit alcohol dehydrogenase family)
MSHFHVNTASVTGTSTGIGRAIALRFSSEGAHVVCADVESTLDDESDGGTHNAILNGGGSAQFVSTNVGCSQEVENLVRVTVAQHGRLDMYVNLLRCVDGEYCWYPFFPADQMLPKIAL